MIKFEDYHAETGGDPINAFGSWMELHAVNPDLEFVYEFLSDEISDVEQLPDGVEVFEGFLLDTVIEEVR